MKRIFLFILTALALSSFTVSNHKSQSSNYQPVCGPTIIVNTPANANGDFIIKSIKLDFTPASGPIDGLLPFQRTGDADQSFFPSSGGLCTITVKVETLSNSAANYVGIKDYLGNVIDSKLLSWPVGTYGYTFSTTNLYCGGVFTVFTT
jgi:hypothetical protein